MMSVINERRLQNVNILHLVRIVFGSHDSSNGIEKAINNRSRINLNFPVNWSLVILNGLRQTPSVSRAQAVFCLP